MTLTEYELAFETELELLWHTERANYVNWDAFVYTMWTQFNSMEQ